MFEETIGVENREGGRTLKKKRWAFPLLFSSMIFLTLCSATPSQAIERENTDVGIGFATIHTNRPDPPPTTWDPTIPSGDRPVNKKSGGFLPDTSHKRLPTTGESVQELFRQLGYLALLIALICLLLKRNKEGEDNEETTTFT